MEPAGADTVNGEGGRNTRGEVISEEGRGTIWRVTVATTVVLILGVFLFQTLSILHPPLLFVLLVAALVPFRGREGHSTLIVICAVLTSLWLLGEAGHLLAPFALAAVLAYILDPLVDRLTDRGLSRSLAVSVLIVPALVLLAVLALVVVPASIRELLATLEAVPVLLERLSHWIERVQERLLTVQVPFFDGGDIVARLRSIDEASVMAFLEERQSALVRSMWDGLLGLGRGIGSFVAILGYVVLTPVLSFYLIRDWDLIMARMVELVPPHSREAFTSFFAEVDGLVSGYLRGQVLVAATIGTLTGVGLELLRFPYGATIGVVSGVLSLVPYVGIVLTLIPAVFIALVSGHVGLSLLKVGVVFGFVQAADATVITPRIVGSSVGIHPVWVVLALSLGGYFFGVVGLLVGVPAAAVVKMLLQRGLRRYERTAFYRGADGSEAG